MSPAEILQWLRAMQSTPDLSLAARAVGMALALRMNARTGEAFPSKAQICADSNLGSEAVRKAIALLAGAGLLEVRFSNGRRSNRYRLSQPNPVASNPVASNPVARNGDNPPTSEEVESMPTPQFGGGVESEPTPQFGEGVENGQPPRYNAPTPPFRGGSTPPFGGGGKEQIKEQRKEKSTDPLARARPSPVRIPENWEPDRAALEWIASFGVTAREAEPAVLEFRSYWAQRTTKRADWSLAFRRNARAEGTLIRLRNAKQGQGTAAASYEPHYFKPFIFE